MFYFSVLLLCNLIPRSLWYIFHLWKEALILFVLTITMKHLGMGLFLFSMPGTEYWVLLIWKFMWFSCGETKKNCVLISCSIFPLFYFSNFYELVVISCAPIPCAFFKNYFFSPLKSLTLLSQKYLQFCLLNLLILMNLLFWILLF